MKHMGSVPNTFFFSQERMSIDILSFLYFFYFLHLST